MPEQRQLNHALVEDSRPPMYKAMKYWGKKPHNIWSEFIECYCPEGGIVLDPFSGSGVAAFETVIQNRRVISFDINPLSTFFIEVNTCEFSRERFETAANAIIAEISLDPIYQEHYTTVYNEKPATIYNYIWKDGTVWKINAKSEDESISTFATEVDKTRCNAQNEINIPFWYPTERFPDSPLITGAFIRDVGGNDFSYLWTKRNLYILAKIFQLIVKQPDNLHLPLLYAFIHTLHLVSKMVVARQERGNRSFSGSWGRADYMVRNRRMEQNPLVVFKRACFDRQGVIAALENAKNRLPTNLKVNEIRRGSHYQNMADINFGQIDVADLTDYIPEKSIDFVITDPPYGGLVQYMDLSLIWLVWLQKYNRKYTPDSSSEITVKQGLVDRDLYRRRMKKAFENIHKVLKDDGYLVVTFHNKEMEEWNDFVGAVRSAGFIFDKVTHQYNRRSGESNVSNPYGTAASDFYIRCVKHRGVDFTDEATALPFFILNRTIDLIARRAEPTPYEFIQNGVLPELLQAGYLEPTGPTMALEQMLSEYIGAGKIFNVEHRDNNTGDIWWFNTPQEHINYPDIPLSSRVDEAVLALLRRQISVKLDDVIAELFRMYPNGLTPDPRKIVNVIQKYAIQSAGKWKLKANINSEITKHSEIIEALCKIGLRLDFCTFVGRREQYEKASNGRMLRDICTYSDLSFLSNIYNEQQLERITMIDCIFLTETELNYIFEVENSTNFSDAIIRASNTSPNIPKYMVIPDNREEELTRCIDPLFRTSFTTQNWRYLLYSDVRRLATTRHIKTDLIKAISRQLG